MSSAFTRFAAVMVGVTVAAFSAGSSIHGQGVKCDPGNGGLTLPAGFCALVVADGLGAARHLAVAPNGDLYVALMSTGGRGTPEVGGGAVALRDANGDGRFEVKETFAAGSATGIALRNGYVYLAHPRSIERFKLTSGQLKPGAAETIVSGFPEDAQHQDKGIAFDGRGSLYVSVGAPSNACQNPDRRPGAKGQDPCPLLERHAGIWKFNENTVGQKHATGTRFATGLRQMPAITWHDNALFIAMNSRDQLDVFWPDLFNAKENAERPAEPLYRAVQGSDFGWPYCFPEYPTKSVLLNPEYGGDGKTVGRCSKFTAPVAYFPAHWAPMALEFYNGTQFPQKYRGGVFVAFHGSWNRSPQAQDGFNVSFLPFAKGQPSGQHEIFANGFSGKQVMVPNDATYRANGVAVAPDGSLYIGESQKGRIWRVVYQGK